METYDGLPFPRTALAIEAVRHARAIESPPIFNHSMRTYLYGRFTGETQGVLPGRDYDDELFFLACVLHDVGLSEPGNGRRSFEIDGADLAANWLVERGLPRDRAEVVWDAVALHLSPAIALRKRPEIALVTAGAGYDIGGDGPPLPAGYAERVHAVLPRLRAAAALHDEILAQALADPRKAPPFSLPGELVRRATGQTWPTWREMAGWGDYDGVS
ncbi:HD domain-containing protein [Nonomuraea sp. NPDC050547]|uniref:HD domain-containing protein n=1 Tax=Nonomuraea sp. NPDC050547 TaxID=3364368 RepID=UPI0037AECBF5